MSTDHRDKVISLAVVRAELRREQDASREMWTCLCGCWEFRWYADTGLTCASCETVQNLPRSR